MRLICGRRRDETGHASFVRRSIERKLFDVSFRYVILAVIAVTLVLLAWLLMTRGTETTGEPAPDPTSAQRTFID